MKVAVVYESMFGNTRQIATAIAEGFGDRHQVSTMCVADLDPRDLEGADMLVVGGPTHAWTMSRESTRLAAVQQASDPDRRLTLEDGAAGPGLREWLADADLASVSAAAFDTRVDLPRAFTGSAARSIERELRRRGCRIAMRRRSFVVTKQNTLVNGEIDRARRWGAELSDAIAAAAPAGAMLR